MKEWGKILSFRRGFGEPIKKEIKMKKIIAAMAMAGFLASVGSVYAGDKAEPAKDAKTVAAAETKPAEKKAETKPAETKPAEKKSGY
jgi:hypothetical protein